VTWHYRATIAMSHHRQKIAAGSAWRATQSTVSMWLSASQQMRVAAYGMEACPERVKGNDLMPSAEHSQDAGWPKECYLRVKDLDAGRKVAASRHPCQFCRVPTAALLFLGDARGSSSSMRGW
jgi:hypothetical protein